MDRRAEANLVEGLRQATGFDLVMSWSLRSAGLLREPRRSNTDAVSRDPSARQCAGNDPDHRRGARCLDAGAMG
jgi:hypothetical protein